MRTGFFFFKNLTFAIADTGWMGGFSCFNGFFFFYIHACLDFHVPQRDMFHEFHASQTKIFCSLGLKFSFQTPGHGRNLWFEGQLMNPCQSLALYRGR